MDSHGRIKLVRQKMKPVVSKRGLIDAPYRAVMIGNTQIGLVHDGQTRLHLHGRFSDEDVKEFEESLSAILEAEVEAHMPPEMPVEGLEEDHDYGDF